jgi:ricin-type beta-trefoil lectin protein
VAAAAAVILVGVVAGQVPASPARADVSGSITGPGGKCIDVSGGVSVEGAQVQLGTCDGAASQTWVSLESGTIHTMGMCLDVSEGGTAAGTPVVLWVCDGGSAQQWIRMNSALFNPMSGKCLDAQWGATADGTPLWIWDCNGTAAQQWSLPGLESSITPPAGADWAELYVPYDPLASGGPYCLDVPGGNGRSGTALQVFHCHGYSSDGYPQQWQFTHLSDNSYWIWNRNDLLCVTAKQASPGVTRGPVVQAPCGQFSNQAWWLVPAGFTPGRFKLQSTSVTNSCMTGGTAGWDSCFSPSVLVQYEEIWALG